MQEAVAVGPCLASPPPKVRVDFVAGQIGINSFCESIRELLGLRLVAPVHIGMRAIQQCLQPSLICAANQLPFILS